MSPNASRQSTGKMTNRPHFAHIHSWGPTPRVTPSDSKVTQKWVRSHFESLWGHFNAFCVSLKLGGRRLHKLFPFLNNQLLQCSKLGYEKSAPKFPCIKFFQIRDVPTQILGHPGHSLSKTTGKGHLHKVFVRDIPTSGSRMSQEYPAQKLYV